MALHQPDLTELHEMLKAKLPEQQLEKICLFSEQYYSTASRQELAQRDVQDLYGATISCWQFIQQHEVDEVKLRVFNPDFEEHGWQSTHSVVELLIKDMPFLVDSLRMELNRQDIVIHSILHAVLPIERDENFRMMPDSPLDKKVAGAQEEAIIYMEIDRHSEASQLQHIYERLLEVVAEVTSAVSDFWAMKENCQALIEELSEVRIPSFESEYAESKAFLEWLNNEHFTFLGYDEFKVEQRNGESAVVRDVSKDLGIQSRRKPEANVFKLAELQEEARSFILAPHLISFTKSGNRSLVHRPAYADYVVVKQFNDDGEVIGGRRFVGLFTSNVYTESPGRIPLVREKVSNILELSGFARTGHNGKELARTLDIYPRDEIFQTSTDQLFDTALSILKINERRQTRVFFRKDSYSKFLNCVVFVPRDVYSTDLRLRIQHIFLEYVQADDIEFTTYFSESILARTYFTLRLTENQTLDLDVAAIERKIQLAAKSWTDELHSALLDAAGEETGNQNYQLYRNAFPASYKEDFSSRTAAADIQHIQELNPDNDLSMSFYREVEEQGNVLRFKLFSYNKQLPLSDVIPILENLGLRVIGEHPYELSRSDGNHIWIHNFSLVFVLSDSIDLHQVKGLFQEAFDAVWHGRAESDGFNRMVLGAELSWREIAMLRAYARYIKQIRFGLSESYIADTLCRYGDISRMLVDIFKCKFHPEISGREAMGAQKAVDFLASMETVEQLNEDRILRRFMELISATLRTNFYQTQAGELKDYFSFKLDPHGISDMPLPRPMFEIFVYSPRVEGVHLRGGKVARGGLRWSDRNEDFRTEVLGLVKAQQVKNAVIVPVGAKGGFVAKCLPDGDREAFMSEGIACYKTFISALLDVTDNLVAGEVSHPQEVVRHDGDDTYLVVAADKGTATFSDIANEIAINRGFWLGDAFASGGSVGYDHKKMGITARGAWVSVQRHFREKGINVQEEDFTVVGIGDMSGDVFGNGMLLSEHIQLVVAFNHLHIFIDPNPDSAKSFVERQRLFDLPRSSWADYDKKLISSGGGIFSRQAKSISLTKEMKERFDIKADKLAPNALLHEILKAPVDLIWNGGIGTYIKASTESHADAGDKANDVLRINGNEVRAKVLGEGGNLGVTQLARIEYALNGGASYTDFIDNAAGVDCSDHEVNIKILLGDVLAAGDMTEKQRNQLLVKMTESVSDLVLKNNYRQTQAISLAQSEARERADEYLRLMQEYEAAGKLDRVLEFLPDDEAFQERKNQNKGLTRPELSVLISYAKADLKEALIDPQLVDNPYMEKALETAFPGELLKSQKKIMYSHRLRAEIVATQVANDMVNRMGITYVARLSDATGASLPEVAKAFVSARDVFGMEALWQEIEALDYQLSSEVQTSMMIDLIRLIRRASRWFIRNRRGHMDVASDVKKLAPHVTNIAQRLSEWLHGRACGLWQERFEALSAQGVPEALARSVASATSLIPALAIIEAADETGESVDVVAETYFALGNHLELDWFGEQINKLKVGSRWEALARESFRDDLEWQQRSLTISALRSGNQENVADRLATWEDQHQLLVQRWQIMLNELRSTERSEFSMYSVALRELLDLAQSSAFAKTVPE